jgi:tetratricopeptide (TPR) repeat protein
MSTKTRCLTMLTAFVLAVPVAASAQEAAPLTRDDLVRMLGGTTYTPDEVAEIVQRSCVSFEPTGADYERFRELGANQAVVDAVRGCVEGEEGGAARVEGLEVVQITLSDDSLVGSVGDTLQLTATIGQEGNPRQGVRLVLRDTSSAGLGTVLDLDGETDGQGRVTFSVPAGEQPGELDLRVFASGVWLEGDNSVVLQVSPGVPTVVRLEPDSVDFQRQRVEQIEVRAVVEDRFGNPVPGAEVRIRSAEAGATEVGWTGRTDDQGTATVTIPASGLHDGERLEASVEGTVLASLPVVVRAPAAIEDPEGRQPGEAELEGPVEAGALTDEQISEMVQRAGRLYRDGALTTADSLYRRVLDERGGNLAALAGRGWVALRGGDLQAARERFQAAVQADPTYVPARFGLGETALAQGDTWVAVQAYEAATRHDPESAEAWTGLGRARIAAGDASAAREALERALELDPGSSEARRALDGLEASPAAVPAVVATAWGGYNPENGRDPGPRMAELVIYPSPQVRLWGSFDNALNLRRPFLVRGEVDFRAFYGGAAFDWGSGESLGTTLEIGHRNRPPDDLGQTVFRLEQAFRFGEGDDPFTRPSVHVGGVLGSWEDRDDYVVLAGVGVPVSPQFRLEPEAWYGETIGTVSSSLENRGADREFRFSLGATARPHERVMLRPALAVGSVDNDLEAQTGELFDATFQASVRVAGPLALEGFFRYQSPPAGRSFTVVGFGTTISIPR